MPENKPICPYCGGHNMEYKVVSNDPHGGHEDWVCPDCGYVGTEEIDPRSLLDPGCW